MRAKKDLFRMVIFLIVGVFLVMHNGTKSSVVFM